METSTIPPFTASFREWAMYERLRNFADRLTKDHETTRRLARSVDRRVRWAPERKRPLRHRRRVGAYWEQLGKLQFDFLIAQGLQPQSRVLDIGCGALRAGVHLVDFLDPDHYYGIDIDEHLLDAGYTVELSDEQRRKLSREHLRRTDRFDVDFGVEFDFAIAQSVFTHLSLNHLRLCLFRVAAATRIGGRFFVTFVEAPRDFPLDGVLLQPRPKRRGDDKKRYTEREPYWYWLSDIEWAAGFSSWRVHYIGDWGHPRYQQLVELVRTP